MKNIICDNRESERSVIVNDPDAGESEKSSADISDSSQPCLKSIDPSRLYLNISHYFLFILIALSTILCWKMVQSYIDPIVIAVILSVLSFPIYEWIEKRCSGRKNLAALISCILLNMVIIIPLFLIFSAVIRQGILSVSAINMWIADGNIERVAQTPLVAKAISFIHQQMEGTLLKGVDIHSMVITISSHAGELLVDQGKYVIGNISSVAVKFMIMTFVFFFVVQDQKKIFGYISHLSPLSASHERILTDKIKAVAKSAILGTLVTAASQGTAGGIAFAICGFPGMFWGAVMAFASLVPFVGTALIWVPAAAWLFLSGSWGMALFLTIWSLLVVGTMDNIVRPLFMKGSAGMGTLLIFFSILGGLSYFGITGLLYGPMIFGLTIVLLYIYDLEFHDFLEHQDES